MVPSTAGCCAASPSCLHALLTPPGRSHFGSRQQTLKKAYSGEQIAEQEVGNGSKHTPSATSFGDARRRAQEQRQEDRYFTSNGF
ncbi:hypothetical protein U9M48_004532 [Paspalum notatum var. saurae]|uniref:Uncharacterized protein n=1 Tax=Paspalum notatum var. saurae TaxID=547442 RepID=A0AAQ3SEW9_PASNO